MKIDAVDPQAAADNPPPPPGNNGQVPGPLQPPKPSKTPSNSAVSWNVDACSILLQPPQPSVGDPAVVSLFTCVLLTFSTDQSQNLKKYIKNTKKTRSLEKGPEDFALPTLLSKLSMPKASAIAA